MQVFLLRPKMYLNFVWVVGPFGKCFFPIPSPGVVNLIFWDPCKQSLFPVNVFGQLPSRY